MFMLLYHATIFCTYVELVLITLSTYLF